MNFYFDEKRVLLDLNCKKWKSIWIWEEVEIYKKLNHVKNGIYFILLPCEILMNFCRFLHVN